VKHGSRKIANPFFQASGAPAESFHDVGHAGERKIERELSFKPRLWTHPAKIGGGGTRSQLKLASAAAVSRGTTEHYLYGMKTILCAALFACLAVGSTWAQDVPANFRFNWESGEVSMDMHLEDNTWELKGTTLIYTQTISGRGENLPGAKSPFRPTTVLNKDQGAKLKTLLMILVKEHSVSLLPKNYQGSLLRYSLSFGSPEKEVNFEAPQIDVNKMNAANPAGTAPSAGAPPAGRLLYSFDRLRDYLVTTSSR
jgi:hypothetical protein